MTTTKLIEIGELKVGDTFTDVAPGANWCEYVISWIGREVEACPTWDKNEEHVATFKLDEIVQITTI